MTTSGSRCLFFRLDSGDLPVIDDEDVYGRFVHGEVDDLQVYLKHVQLVDSEAECAREAVLSFGTRLRRSCSLARSNCSLGRDIIIAIIAFIASRLGTHHLDRCAP